MVHHRQLRLGVCFQTGRVYVVCMGMRAYRNHVILKLASNLFYPMAPYSCCLTRLTCFFWILNLSFFSWTWTRTRLRLDGRLSAYPSFWASSQPEFTHIIHVGAYGKGSMNSLKQENVVKVVRAPTETSRVQVKCRYRG